MVLLRYLAEQGAIAPPVPDAPAAGAGAMATAAAAPPPHPGHLLIRGSTGPEVELLQHRLLFWACDPKRLDGDFDAKTATPSMSTARSARRPERRCSVATRRIRHSPR